MIVSYTKLMNMPEFNGLSETVIKRKLAALENLVRAYTNNNFQNRKIRFDAPSSNVLLGSCKLLKVGDTVQITESINDGLYVISKIDLVNKTITLDSNLMETPHNLVTKVEYPSSIEEGVINLILWDVQNRSKIGIQSETLSRHSVTYFSQDKANQLMGFPAILFGFLKPYIKARF